MKRYLKYILFFVFGIFFLQTRAGLGSQGGVPSLTKDDVVFIVDFFKNNFLLTVFNFIYLIAFSIWVRKQSLNEEILLYQIRGKFTPFNINLWIERIENNRLMKLNGTRRKVNIFIKKSQELKVPLSLYRPAIQKFILKSSFGKKAYKASFQRMHKNTKLLIIGQLSQIVISTVLAISFWINELGGFIGGFFVGICTSLFIGSVYWAFINLVFSWIIKIHVNFLKNKNGHAGYWHIVSAQLHGFFGLMWRSIPIPQRALMSLTDIELKNGYTEIVFKDFKGGGAGGNW